MKFLLRLCLFVLSLMTTPALAASCYISEFTNYGDAGIQIPKQPSTVDQGPIAVSPLSAQSAAFSGSTRVIRLDCDVTVSYAVGPNPTATTSSSRLPAGIVEYMQVVAGQRIAFTSVTGGTVPAPGPSQALFNTPYYTCLRNFYVNASTGNDTRTTTQAQNSNTPWLTIGNYNAVIGAGNTGGDCINVAAGTYTTGSGATGVGFTKGGSTASATGYVVYRCQTMNACIVTDPGNSGPTGINAAFAFSANYIMVDGFTVNGGNGTSANTEAFGTCNDQTCGFGGSNSHYSFHHIWVLNNIMSGYGQAGVQFANSEYWYVIHNTIFNNSHDCNGNAQGSGISYYLPINLNGYTRTGDDANNPVTGNTGNLFHIFANWNVIYNHYICPPGNPGVTDGNGIILDDWMGDQYATCNAAGQPCNYTGGGLVEHNVIYNNGAKAVHPFNAGYVTIVNNSAFNDDLDPNITGPVDPGFMGEIDDNGSYGLNIKNNIAFNGCGTGQQALVSAMAINGVHVAPLTTTLSAAITTTGQASITVASATNFPGGAAWNATKGDGGFLLWNNQNILPGGNLIQIDSEILFVTAGWNTTTWTVQRGYNGTTAATHLNGATVTWNHSYWSNNITHTTGSCTEIAFENSGQPSWYSSTANKEATLPGWVNVGNTSFGGETTQPVGTNFALSGGSPAIGYGSIAPPFDFLPSQAADAGACYHTLATCP